MARRALIALRAAAAAALVYAAAAGCSSEMIATAPSSDQDRQCQPQSGCTGGLLCVSLYGIKVYGDGGVTEVMNYTCHAPCDAMECPTSYGCYTVPAGQTGMGQKVCVQQKVLETLRASRDGG